MDKDTLLQITNELYRLTLLFPKKEPLRYKMRELADDILAKPNEKDLEVLDGFFEVAKAQNWVSPAEVLKLQQEYSMLKENLEQQNSSVPVVQFRNILRKDFVILDPKSGGDCGENPKAVPNERQQKILEILKEREKAQVWEIKKFFPEVAKRTLRRDFEFLLQEGAVERIGERNDTYYTRARQSRAKGGDEDLSSSTKLKSIET